MGIALYEDAVETIPGLLVTEIGEHRAPADRSQVYELIATNGQLLARLEAAEARAADLADKLHQTQLLASGLSAQVALLKGEGLTPSRGCEIASVPYECGYLVVEFEHEPAEAATPDHPGAQAVISPSRVFVGGRWLGAQELAEFLTSDALVERIAERLEC